MLLGLKEKVLAIYLPGNLNSKKKKETMAKIISIILLMGFIVTMPLLATETGFAFLKMPVAARGAATMTVFSQISTSPFSVFENPAGLNSTGLQVGVSHILWFNEVKSHAIAASFPVGKCNLGTGINLVRIPGIEIREKPTAEPDGITEAQYLNSTVGISYSPFKTLTLGIAGKFIYEHLYTNSATGYAFDISGRWLAPSSLDISFLISNLGRAQELESERSELPTTLKIGIIRPEIFTEGPVNVSVGLNLVSIIPTQQTYIQAGMEMRITDYTALRGGFERVGVINRTALGFGLRFGQFGLDYTFIFMPEGLGYPHLFTFNLYPKSSVK